MIVSASASGSAARSRGLPDLSLVVNFAMVSGRRKKRQLWRGWAEENFKGKKEEEITEVFLYC